MKDNPAPKDSANESPSAIDVEALFSSFRAPLRRYFGKRVRNQQEVEDLVQDVFLRLSAKTNGSQIAEPQAYIFQIAANLLRDKARKEINQRVSAKEFIDQNENNFEEISPERVLLGRQGISALKDALNELPERTRAIFLLHRFEELKYREIAERLGVSMSSVEKHMMDAIKHLTYRLRRPE